MNNIEIRGNTTQKEDVDPEKPKEIKNEVILSVIDNDGKQKQIPIDIAFNGLKEGEYFFKENGKWYLHKLEDRTERIETMNNIENIKFFLGDLKASNYNLSFIQDVENLIQENKELKEENSRIKSLDYTALAEEMEMGLWMPRADVEEYYIPIERLNDYIEKLKVKEKIEWYKKYCDLDKCVIKVLEELLEEGE